MSHFSCVQSSHMSSLNLGDFLSLQSYSEDKEAPHPQLYQSFFHLH